MKKPAQARLLLRSLILAIATANVYAAEVEIQGIVEFNSAHPALPLEKRHYKKAFTVSITNCQWQIKSLFIEPSATLSSQSQITGFDGVHLYSVSEYGSTNGAAALAESFQIPIPDSSLSSFVWLAFCSGCYLNAQTNSTAEPVWFLADSKLRRQRYDTVLQPLTGSDGLPQILEYSSRASFRVLSDGKIEKYPYFPGYSRSVVEGRYQLLKSTNMGGRQFPLSASFTRFGPGPGLTNPPVLYEISLNVERISPTLTISSVIPEMSSNTVYSERRFAQNASMRDSFIVEAKNGKFPKAESLSSLAQKIATANERASKSSLPKILAITIALTILTLPPILWFAIKGLSKPRKKDSP